MTRPRTPRAVTVTLSRDDRHLLASAGTMHVESCADGTLRVTPAWAGEVPADCREEHRGGDCPRCGYPHTAGLMTRMALADVVQRVLRAVGEGPCR